MSSLDAYAARAIMIMLRKLAFMGHTIVATIHQPSAKIFQLLDQLSRNIFYEKKFVRVFGLWQLLIDDDDEQLSSQKGKLFLQVHPIKWLITSKNWDIHVPIIATLPITSVMKCHLLFELLLLFLFRVGFFSIRIAQIYSVSSLKCNFVMSPKKSKEQIKLKVMKKHKMSIDWHFEVPLQNKFSNWSLLGQNVLILAKFNKMKFFVFLKEWSRWLK